jgi:dephospho-CoA kinase
MLLVGLTGGIASGKSLVARALRDLGARVIDADRIVHELLEPGQEACKEVLARFGNDIALPQGGIDRRKLGEIVFNDAVQRKWLNNCLHPRVFVAYTARVERLRARAPEAVVVFDAALLIETGYHRTMEKLVVVYAEQEQQVARLIARDHFTREQALARISAQMPLGEKRGLADYVIDNTGSPEDAERRTRDLFAKLKQDAERA